MELVFVGHPIFLSTLAVVLPEAKREPGPVESLPRDDTAFVCPMDSSGMHLDPVYDRKEMFRGSQVNALKTIHRLGSSGEQEEPRLPLCSALGLSVWGSSWLIGSVTGNYDYKERSVVAYDAFYAAYIVARTLPGVNRLVCPPLCVKPGRLGFQSSAAQIARAYKELVRVPEQTAVVMQDSRGVDCYVAVFKDAGEP